MNHPIRINSRGRTVIGKQLQSGMILVWDGSISQWIPTKVDTLMVRWFGDTSNHNHL